MFLQLTRIMKIHRATKKLLTCLLSCFFLGFGLFANPVLAETETETKIRLMSEALTARNAGDLETARDKLQQLQEIAPEDRGVRRLLENVEAAIEARPTDEPPAEPEAPAQNIRRAELWSQAVSARNRGDFEEARRIAEVIGEEFPRDSRVAPFLDGLADRRVAMEEAQRIEAASTEARAVLAAAPDWIAAGEYDLAVNEIEAALEELPENVRTVSLIVELKKVRSEAVAKKALAQLRAGDIVDAEQTLAIYDGYDETNMAARQAAREVVLGLDDPSYIRMEDVSPGLAEERERIRNLLRQGRAQYLSGDLHGAEDTFRRVEAMDATNPQAKVFMRRISAERASTSHLDRRRTREQLLEEVADGWRRPQMWLEEIEEEVVDEESPIEVKLREIVIDSVNFTDVPLRRVIATLNDISREYDDENEGVNIVLRDRDQLNPDINISLRNMSLGRILDFIVVDVGFRYEVEQDVVVVSPADDVRTDLQTEIFPIAQSTLIRITGAGPAAAPDNDDPFGAPQQNGGGGQISQRLQQFLQGAGINFPEGTNLVYDGSGIIVTQTSRNLERIRNLLSRYADVRQVEIEARFLEVQQGALDELGFSYEAQRGGTPQVDPATGLPILDAAGRQVMGGFRQIFGTDNRSLAESRTGMEAGSQVTVDSPQLSLSIPQGSPDLPGEVPLAGGAGHLAVLRGSIGSFGVDATIRALSRQTGSDLLSAPKVTVLSGETAQITVAQEFRYPEQYSDAQSNVSQAGGTAGGAASGGVTITAGTPQNFQTRNVGVELTVTPTVEDDERSISLDLFPQVTEFEGFVEYGGPSIAIQGETTVTIPSGNFQPIFASRSINTRVTIWDGATLVMGGLTREEVRMVKDKVPILGDIPLLGRLFRSEGEASTKRNLLIFVSANLVSPGGSLRSQELRNVSPGSTFQLPTHVTPGGPVPRIGGQD